MKRLLALLIDATDPDLIEKWMADGSLPNFRRLREAGAYGRLSSTADWMAEATHYVFNTGRNPGATGLVAYSIWQKETMLSRTPTPDWLPSVPFWRSLQAGDARAIIVDPPDVYAPVSFNGLEVVGWATHDTLVPFQTFPPELARRIDDRFGSSLMPDESYGPMRKHDFLEDVRLLQTINRNFEAMCVELMREHAWDFFLACNHTLHHAGHRLWNTSNITDRLSESERAEFGTALRNAYADCDAAIGRIVEAAGEDTRVLLFSLHGMGANQSRTHILPEMLRRIVDKRPSSRGFLQRLRLLVPQRWRHELKSLLPLELRRRLTSYWKMSEYDWSSTRAFALLSDTEGWVRINLKGREAAGIVEPGAEYEALCNEIAEGLMSYADVDSGQALVKEIVRPRDVYSGERLVDLPDLIVVWSHAPAASHRAVHSPLYGTIPWPTPGQNPEGRSGNHRPQGFLIAAGPGVRHASVEGAHILDLAPTILSLLGKQPPAEMEGRTLSLFE